MEPIKAEILAYLKRAGKGEHNDVSLVALDRYLVYVKHEQVFVGGNLQRVIQELAQENLIKFTQASRIALTGQGDTLADRAA